VTKELWYQERGFFSSGFRVNFKVKKSLHKEQTPYQTIEVIDTYTFGKMLLLDGFVMLTERDESAYHEMLVHPAMVTHPAPQNILVIGGGDGGTIREILKYPVKKVTLVDIDKRVIEISREYFPELSKGFFDSRVEVVNADGTQYIKAKHRKFDIIFIDSTDPAGPGAVLVESDFLRNGASILNQEGIWVAQSELPFFAKKFLKSYTNNLKKLFKIVRVYLTEVPSYGGAWAFTFASNKIDPLTPNRQAPSGLKYYNSKIHHASFVLPEYLHIL